jgi:hypothetical protein
MLTLLTKSLIFSILLSSGFFQKTHPIYISNTEIKYNTTTETYQISVKLFADDLEKVFEKKLKEKIELGTEREHPKTKEYLLEYLKSNLIIYSDNKELAYNYIGHESGDKSEMFAMFVYLETKKCKKSTLLSINNTILLAEIATQLNFISFHSQSGIKKYICRKGDTRKSLN